MPFLPRTKRSQVMLVVSAVVGAAGLLVLATQWMNANSGLAAWVQALGALGIIGWSVWNAGQATRTEERRDRIKQARELRAISDICAQVAPAIRAARTAAQSGLSRVRDADLKMHSDILSDIRSSIASIPVLAIPGRSGITASVIELRKITIRAFVIITSDLTTGPLSSTDVSVRALELAAELGELIDKAETAAASIAAGATYWDGMSGAVGNLTSSGAHGATAQTD